MTTEATSHLKLTPTEHGYYTQLYEYVTSKLDNQPVTEIPANTAAEFLRTSGLTIDDLKKIWRLSCVAPNKMTKSEFFTALKLVALRQQKLSYSIDNLKKESGLPEFTIGPKFDKDSIIASETQTPKESMSSSQQFKQYNFSISESTANNIEGYIDKKCKTAKKGILTKNEAQELFNTANLSEMQKGQLWRLCDIEKKGYLSRPQFIVCLYFVSQVKQGTPLPNELPHKIFEFIEKYEGTLEPMPSPVKKETKDTYAGLVNLLLKKCLDQQETIQTIDEKNKNILEDLDREVI